MRKTGFLITPRQYKMLCCIRDKGDPGELYTHMEAAKWQRTWATVRERGFVMDNRVIGSDNSSLVVPEGKNVWELTGSGVRAIWEYERRDKTKALQDQISNQIYTLRDKIAALRPEWNRAQLDSIEGFSALQHIFDTIKMADEFEARFKSEPQSGQRLEKP